MPAVGVLISVVLIGGCGVLLALDVGGFASRASKESRKWWSAGPIRSRVRGVWTNFRAFGVVLVIGAVATLLLALLGHR